MEILAPAGNFESAYYSIEGGADSIYLGLPSFSARKSAKNFTFYELRKILKIANEKNIKVFITINTLFFDNEIEKLLFFLYFLSFFKIDGIIFQDIGLIELLKEFNFSFPLHCSTQLSCNNSSGAIFAFEYLNNLERIILPREFSYNDLIIFVSNFEKKLNDNNNNNNNNCNNHNNYNNNNNNKINKNEFEVFIHGALCYSFSGLCLASGIITGRSGNRGECAQICRNFFSLNNPSINNLYQNKNFENVSFYPFSTVDLFYGDKILKILNNKLLNKYIKSFKIEGRMKSPEYCYWASKYYKNIIKEKDKEKEKDLNQYSSKNETLEDIKRNLSLTFLRESGTPYFENNNGDNLISNKFPFHKGYYLGKTQIINNQKFITYSKYPISINDGFLIYDNKNNKYMIISAQKIKKLNGKEIKFSNGNEKIIIFSDTLKKFKSNEKFVDIYQLSSRFLDLKKIRISSIKDEQKIPIFIQINLDFSFNNKNINNVNNINKVKNLENIENLNIINNIYSLNKIDVNISIIGYIKSYYSNNLKFNFNYLITFEKKTEHKNILSENNLTEKFQKIFEETYKFLFKPEEIKINILQKNSSFCFIPPNMIKKLKRDFYRDLTKLFISHFKTEVKNKINKYISKHEQNIEFINDRKNIAYINNFFIKNKNLNNKDELEELFKSIEFRSIIENRENLNPEYDFFNNKIPFFDPIISNNNKIWNNNNDKGKNNNEKNNNSNNKIKFYEINPNRKSYKIFFIPLKPVIFDSENYYFDYIFNTIKENILSFNDSIIFIGISNIGHINQIKNFLLQNKNNEIFRRIFLFIDFYFYVSNIFGINFLEKLNEILYNKIIFSYLYIEKNFILKKEDSSYLKKNYIPLFYSKGCFAKNNFFNNTCPIDCKKKYKYKIYQNENEFEVLINNCISYFFYK